MALTISTGFVVDDAIVVIENITRYLEKGMAPLEAALEGSKEIGFTVLSMSVSLIAVFIPILLMGGILGRIFREFAITLSVAVGISLVVSLTATPMMCAYLLKQHQQDKREQWPVPHSAARIRFDGRRIRQHPALGAETSALMLCASAGHRLPGGLSVRGHSQGLLSAAGYRAVERSGPERGGYFLSNHAAEARPIHHHPPERSCGGRRDRQHRRAGPIRRRSTSR